MTSAILGDWTHRRGDASGSRFVAADIDHPRPTLAWSWRPPHGGRVDQVRAAGRLVVIATMTPRDPIAPGWEHAVVYAIDAETGVEVARRTLPDPVPVAAMVIDANIVHVVATRKSEPIYWYCLSSTDLAPVKRGIVAIANDVRHDDVLDAWATPGGGLWLELDVVREGHPARARTYAFADVSGAPVVPGLIEEGATEWEPRLAHDACADGSALFVPREGAWTGPGSSDPPTLACLDPNGAAGTHGWARAGVGGPQATIHALGGESVVYAVTAAPDPERPDRARVEALALDRASGGVRWRVSDDRVALRAPLGGAARVARRANGELLFQILGADGVPATSMLCAGPSAAPDGHLDAILLGVRGRYVLDAALGPFVLAHRENKEDRIEVAGFAIDRDGRLLGRRAVAEWTLEVPDLGGGTTVYAGAGLVVIRGARAVAAVKL